MLTEISNDGSVVVYPWHCLVPFLSSTPATTPNDIAPVKSELANPTQFDNDGMSDVLIINASSEINFFNRCSSPVVVVLPHDLLFFFTSENF